MLTTVTAVGGTTLTPASNSRGWTETGYSGWQVAGGTSAAAPIIASAAALAGNTGTVNDAYIYQHSGALFDVIGGSNGSCYGDYHCTGTKGLRRAHGPRQPRRHRRVLSQPGLRPSRKISRAPWRTWLMQPGSCAPGGGTAFLVPSHTP